MTTRVGSLHIEAICAISACTGIGSGEVSVLSDLAEYIGKRVKNHDKDKDILAGVCDFMRKRLIEASAEGRCFKDALEALRKEAPELVELYEEALDPDKTTDIDKFMDKYINEEKVEYYKKQICEERGFEDVFEKED